MNRRLLLLGASAIAIGAVYGVTRESSGPRRVQATSSNILAVVAKEFGEDIANAEDAATFASEAEAFGGDDVLEDTIVLAFLRSTNVVRALETGDDLIFTSFDNPILAPCQNTLSAGWL